MEEQQPQISLAESGDDSDTVQYLRRGKTDFLIALKAEFSV